jgi:hypothetical protein
LKLTVLEHQLLQKQLALVSRWQQQQQQQAALLLLLLLGKQKMMV